VNDNPLKRASALIPIAFSLTGLALVLVHAAIYGVIREADEGTTAHIFQILMLAQLPVVAFFAARWLPRRPGQALIVLAVQALAGLSAFAAVYFLT
jgi:FtsH-binding integral membrane protein